MIKRIPLGVDDFGDIQSHPRYLYVDKTSSIGTLFSAEQTGPHMFLARPRRFGKTLLISLLESLFQGRRDLFAETWIGQEGHWDWEHNGHPVLRLDLSLRGLHDAQRLAHVLGHLVQTQAARHDLQLASSLPPDVQLVDLIRLLAEKSGRKVVVLIDEYDMAITENLGRPDVLDDILDVMRAFYGALKTSVRYIRFTFVTGITHFARTSLFSGANHLTDLSFHPQWNVLLGFTQAELHHDPDMVALVQHCAAHLACAPEELYEALEYHYNGYRFARHGTPVFNPYSLAGCFDALGNPAQAGHWSLRNLPHFWAESAPMSCISSCVPMRRQ